MRGFDLGDRVVIIDVADSAYGGTPDASIRVRLDYYGVKPGTIGTIVEDTGGRITPGFMTNPEDFYTVQLDEGQGVSRGGTIFSTPLTLYAHVNQLELIEEKSMETSKLKNGDVVSVRLMNGSKETVVFVKFGEYFYNLTNGGQMKGYKNLPKGGRKLITNLSGLGSYFLLSKEELDEAITEDSKTDDDGKNPLTGFDATCPF